MDEIKPECRDCELSLLCLAGTIRVLNKCLRCDSVFFEVPQPGVTPVMDGRKPAACASSLPRILCRQCQRQKF